ncbi:MAG: MFS transporter [Butyricimonas faecihominis]
MAKRKNWFSLFFTNYLGVLNDNFLKTLACFICIAWVGKENESMVVTLASAALVIPYLLFSPLAGRLAKIYKKRKIVVWAKFAEMLIMVVAAAGFLTHSTGLVLSSILLMGLQSALFSPSKYGLIRDIGGEEGFLTVPGHGDVRFRGYSDRDVDGGLCVGERDDPGAVRDPVRGGVVRLVVESDDSGARANR